MYEDEENKVLDEPQLLPVKIKEEPNYGYEDEDYDCFVEVGTLETHSNEIYEEERGI